MKIAIVGDVHWSKYSSIVRGRGEKYTTRLEHLINSLNWCEMTADKYETDAMVYLGDFFDRADMNAEEITALKEIGWNYQPHYFLVGNHELGLTATDFNSSEVFGLLPTGNVISKPTTILDNVGNKITFLPYSLEENRPELPVSDIIFSHNDLQMQYGFYKSEIGYDVDEIKTKCKLFINGHLHNHYIFGNIVNLGNICGQNFNEDATKYDHYMMILDTDKCTYTLEKNPYALKFYKFDFCATNKSLAEPLDSNSVVTAKCFAEDACVLENLYADVLEKRLIINRGIVKSDTTTEDIQLDTVDHLEKFRQFVHKEIGDTPIINELLNEVTA